VPTSLGEEEEEESDKEKSTVVPIPSRNEFAWHDRMVDRPNWLPFERSVS
jgi:hypothetical protein